MWLLSMLMSLIGLPPKCDGAVCTGRLSFAETSVISAAGFRNGIEHGSEDWYILLAIRIHENGRPGCEFGIKHPRVWETDLDTQAGWAAATIMNNRRRWHKADRPRNFIDFLGNHYCPTVDDPEGNKNWKKNVKLISTQLKRDACGKEGH